MCACEISDEGMAAIGNMIQKNKALISISLGDNEVTDKGGSFLAKGIENNSTLKYLIIDINNMTDIGITTFINAIHCNHNNGGNAIISIEYNSNINEEIFNNYLSALNHYHPLSYQKEIQNHDIFANGYWDYIYYSDCDVQNRFQEFKDTAIDMMPIQIEEEEKSQTEEIIKEPENKEEIANEPEKKEKKWKFG